MSFVHYRIVLRLLSPLHIGKRKYRNLMETREYVPGRTLWGALTARITRDYFGGRPEFYERVGRFLMENFRFGYLWPSLDGETPYFPWEHNDFDYLFKFSYMGQPIDYGKKSTEEGMLHEVEFIGPKTRKDQQVYFVGDLWIKSSLNSHSDAIINSVKLEDNDALFRKENGEESSLSSVLSTFQLGAERGYGWGRVQCERIFKVNNGSAIGGIAVQIVNDAVVLTFPKSSHLTAHALATEWNGLTSISSDKLIGLIEPFTGYEFKGSFGLISPTICYLPGSKATDSLSVTIGYYGLLSCSLDSPSS
ncbi:RAMP superfamily CRISPR-associated protein [Thermodesulfatator autotrophicus]|uniref:CRISPR type III-associated protein domain-containing protein n=1 Tax=Thermodesulfatator autotrophicus TaxID=1795632 RepID=A0A177E9S3_9BACT|nr:RAMP superfamily CRISPR-associated protein [Thermodesulfatator autotrophicus]OAG28548.1 hypothetical protein TH606_00910 [Thermodesulfatator autotrophicus]